MGGGGSLGSPFGIVICVYCDYSFTCFGYFFLCFLLFVGFRSSFSLPFFRFSVLFLFRCFLFSFAFFASFSSFLLLFLGFSFVCFVLSSSAFLFLPLLFPSSSSSFSFPFWFLLLSPLAPLSRILSRLSLPFLLLLPFLLFLLCPLPSSLFIIRLRFFPSTLFFPSCWLFFLLVCPRCLFGGFLFFLFAFLAFGFRFLLVCVCSDRILTFGILAFGFRFLLVCVCSDRILTFGIRSICSPAKVGLVVTELLITSPVVSWRGWETPPHSTAAQLSFFAQPRLGEDLSLRGGLLSSSATDFVYVFGEWIGLLFDLSI